MSDITRKLAIFGCLLLTSFCFWKAGTGLIGGADASVLSSAQAALSPAVTPPWVVTTPIQQMRPGMRVVGRNPLRLETESTIDPTPEGWRLLSVRMRKEDGTYFEAELLRPLSWISRHRAQPGAIIELNIPDLRVVGAAEVLLISDCPPIDPGDGPIVISTFKNTADNVLDIYVEGEAEPIGVTGGHPIWSEDRQAFVHTDQLQLGERLRSAVGRTVRITSIEIRAGPEPVYNLEVAGEHVYSVTGSGLLVHNVSDCDLVTKIGLPDGSYIDLNAPISSSATQIVEGASTPIQFKGNRVFALMPDKRGGNYRSWQWMNRRTTSTSNRGIHGSPETKAHIQGIVDDLEGRGWTVTNYWDSPAGELYFPGPGGGRLGSSFVDITATKNGRVLHINTVDTLADGVTLSTREATNAARIRQQLQTLFPGQRQHLLTVPKPKVR
ncbi:hypothetical protein CA11_19850 [Gimesia maris]|uniref:polymorphic toxin-type HINT domain-containing protein n=1 Tax=Gimesia maris TaxID=122 RepID=UPI00118A3D3F|nr:polymorphic toxin-type HINT domain-containing protein [Gimesia maris]QDU14181.1 hypothetical protein CA11_19850 [Gimesia maris]